MKQFVSLVRIDLFRYAVSAYSYVKISAFLLISVLTFFSYLGSYNKLVSMKIVAAAEQAHLLNIDIQVLQNYYFLQIMLIILLTPILVSKLLSEDWHGNILESLLASGVSTSKYLAAKAITVFILMSIMILLGSLFPLILVYLENLSVQTIFLGLGSCFLTTFLMIAVSLLVSVWSNFNSMAAVLSVLIAAVLYALEPLSAKVPQNLGLIMQQSSLLYHSRAIISATPALHNLAYFLVFPALLFCWASHALNSERWR